MHYIFLIIFLISRNDAQASRRLERFASLPPTLIPGRRRAPIRLGLLDHPGHKIQPVAHGRRRLLELFAIYVLCNFIVSQAQFDFENLFDRMSKRFDAGGIDGLHLLYQAEEIVQARERGSGFLLRQLKAREVGDTLYIGEGQGHTGTIFFNSCARYSENG
jgi:hypothetical protein